ncbi:MAG: SDR family NAD(P)-dependent oxidoreductase, partial [Maritimibacter sp.]|nr:SDR family NAD(P)-dependent oxidoreductase [Maritimibacter sp.]
MKDLGLAGKRVIVTGAAGGLGRAFAQELIAAGARVLVADINAGGIGETVELLTAAGGEAHGATLDVTSAESARALAAVATEKLGGADVLVNNAALFGALNRAPFMELDEGEWDRVLSVNVKGVWQVSRAIAPLMQAAGGGSIVNIASATV